MLLNAWINPWASHVAALERELGRAFQNASEPALDLWTSENAVRVALRAPGFAPEAFDISIDANVLTLQGAREARTLADGERQHLRERDNERFTRRVRLPFRVEQEQVTARYENGVLWVELPRAHAERAKKINVRAASSENPS